MQLPRLNTLDDYRAIYHRDDVWRPVVEEVCRRHSLPGQTCARGPDGTHIVYMVGASRVVKLFVPFFERDFLAESLVGRVVAGRLGVATPAITGEGEIDGWRYLVMTRVPGRPLGEVWPGLREDDRIRIVGQIGLLIGRVQLSSLEGLESIGCDWRAFLRSRVAAVQLDRLSIVREDPARAAAAYVESSGLLRVAETAPVLLLCDVTREHVMVAKGGGSWGVVGYVDFGDSMIGPRDYEVVAPGVDIARGNRALLRELLLGAGYAEGELDDALRRRLMSCMLVHQYLDLGEVARLVPAAASASSLDELAGVLWPVC